METEIFSQFDIQSNASIFFFSYFFSSHAVLEASLFILLKYASDITKYNLKSFNLTVFKQKIAFKVAKLD